MFMQDNFYQYGIDIIAYVMNQLSLKATEAEAKQLHWRKSFQPVHGKELTKDHVKK
jgi:hypothetical protein